MGKTTTAAAAAVMAAIRHGSKVLVLTVDPAKRLADALGLDGIGNTEHRVPDEAFRAAGIKPRGQLWAAMLDTKESWDALIRRHAPDTQTRDEILANPLYQNISGRFIQSHDYIAMERLYEIHSESDYDLIVVDTPPTRNALDFLDAPQRMADFFSSRLLRWLIVPYRSRLVNVATKPFYQIADRILGTEFLADISEFFILFQSMYDGFVERSESVGRLVSDRRTTFIVVSTLEAVPLREAEFFAEELTARRLHLGAIVLNKVLPVYLRGAEGATVAESMKDRAADLASHLAPAWGRWTPPSATPTRSPGSSPRWPTAISISRWSPCARWRSGPCSRWFPTCWPPCRSSTRTSSIWPGWSGLGEQIWGRSPAPTDRAPGPVPGDGPAGPAPPDLRYDGDRHRRTRIGAVRHRAHHGPAPVPRGAGRRTCGPPSTSPG